MSGLIKVLSRRARSMVVLVALCAGSIVPPAAAAPSWASEALATIHPGVQTFTGGGQCTANFVFFNGGSVYIGQAAHCSGTGSATDTDGCTSGTLPPGTPVRVAGASKPATMVYNSWATMQLNKESDPNACAFNDFALLRLDPADAGKVNPTVPHWGGPAGINTAGTVSGQTVYSYGNSSLRFGLSQLSPKKGTSNGDTGGGWSHVVTTLTPGIPGDSGSAFLDASGKALGVLSTLQVGIPGGVTNGVGDINKELDYMRAHEPSLAGVRLAPGTRRFSPGKVPLGI